MEAFRAWKQESNAQRRCAVKHQAVHAALTKAIEDILCLNTRRWLEFEIALGPISFSQSVSHSASQATSQPLSRRVTNFILSYSWPHCFKWFLSFGTKWPGKFQKGLSELEPVGEWSRQLDNELPRRSHSEVPTLFNVVLWRIFSSREAACIVLLQTYREVDTSMSSHWRER